MAGTRTMGSKLKLIAADQESTDKVFTHLESIGAINGEAEEIDVTDLDSEENVGGNEFIQGAKDYGTLECVMRVIAANADDVSILESLFTSGDIRDWNVIDKTGTVALKGYVSAAGYGEKTTDGLSTYNFSIRISGRPTFTKASA